MAYHRGELAVQVRAGVRDESARVERVARDTVPRVAAEFLTRQPVLFLGAADAAGRLWSTALTGRPGFLAAPDERTISVAARPNAADPLAAALTRPTQVGTIAIEPDTRRRMRVNGLARPTPDGLAVDVEQVVANCPQYIQRRSPLPVAPGSPTATWSESLSEAQRRVIAAADTFFVTTAADESVDTSHRGGNPGFVQVGPGAELEWPDYSGNAMFLTLGNLELDPRAGLLFPDWSTGTALHLSGTAVVDWSAESAARHPGAQRVVRFTVADVVEVADAIPLHWSAPEFSRFNPAV
ncbi:pyridoxamine 5'-phosphate oxidase family protein [Actinokineospora auranticolor]|uniref:Uncharacterized protein n=1 Tax=Actinokineospora auranticolor TaxID=155976 RepID=A0A2S6GTV4_9PSEU|nr:pyridoxamine 5'-phosphate oxidase family protein [Actinokineospora auranticolor]PPK68551.1 hypothetical protein CLV40_105280 [Actinokineospora auranticolor]